MTEESPSSHGARVPSRLTPEPSRQDRQISDLATFQTCLTIAVYLGVLAACILAALVFTSPNPSGVARTIGTVLKWVALIPIAVALVLGIPLVIACRFSGKPH